MRRFNQDDGIAGRVAKVTTAIVLAGAGLLLLGQLGSLRRYLGIRRMSARKHPTPPGTLRADADTAPRWGTAHWPMR